jgi:hypothetical protein
MASRYVEISKAEMEKFIKNSYRPYRPKPGRVGDMLTYTLQLSPNVGIRIHTSLSVGRTEVRGVGDDAIEVFLVSLKLKGRQEYLMTRSTQKKHGVVLVMRTKNWRSALDDRVDKLIDIYEDNEEYWDKRAQGTSEQAIGPSPKQLDYMKKLVGLVFQRDLQDKVRWSEFGLDGKVESMDFSKLEPGRGGSASRFIDHVRSVLDTEEAEAEKDRAQNDQKSEEESSGGPTDAQVQRLGYHLRGKEWLWRKHNLDRFGPVPRGPEDFRQRFTREQAADIIKILDDSLSAWQRSRQRSASEELVGWGNITEDEAETLYGPVAG